MTATQLACLAGCVLALMLAAMSIDLKSSLEQCQRSGHSYATCHAALYR